MFIYKAVKIICLHISAFIQNFIKTNYSKDMSICNAIIVKNVHEKTFSKYKNMYAGKEIAVIATGPSLNQYKPLDNVINIGVNKAILYDKVKLDYYFVIDYRATRTYIEKAAEYDNLTCFYAAYNQTAIGCKEISLTGSIVPESVRLRHKADRFFIYSKYPVNPIPFNVNIESSYLGDGASCIFSAMQFALYTNPKRIYIAGCDCSTGHYDEKNSKIKVNKALLKSWKELKKFAEIYYPETEIVSINPVGLKGLFKDVYQEDEK